MPEKLMCKRLYTILNNNNIIYNLQFGFRQQYSTSHALINITENIRKALDGGNIGCGVFVIMRFVEFRMIGLNPICLIVISIYP